MSIRVRNADTKAAPNVAVTVETDPGKPGEGTAAFGQRVDDSRLSDPKRPIWIVDDGPAGGDSAATNTWALGRLKAGQTKEFLWKVTAVEPGSYTISTASPPASTAAPGSPPAAAPTAPSRSRSTTSRSPPASTTTATSSAATRRARRGERTHGRRPRTATAASRTGVRADVLDLPQLLGLSSAPAGTHPLHQPVLTFVRRGVDVRQTRWSERRADLPARGDRAPGALGALALDEDPVVAGAPRGARALLVARGKAAVAAGADAQRAVARRAGVRRACPPSAACLTAARALLALVARRARAQRGSPGAMMR